MFRRRPPDPAPPPEWLIAGLGNPGPEYAGTRHNVGFEAVDRLARLHGLRLDQRKFRALYGAGTIGGAPVALCKPMTYMNLCGQAVAPLLRHFGLGPGRLLVIADELDLPAGKVRMRPKGGAAGHNGHRSIQAALGAQDYPRIRVGIASPADGGTVAHVLSRFHSSERAAIDAALDLVVAGVETLLTEGIDKALTQVNAP
jgi:PTH1 family peptidyl-tRNA hydrolase